MQKPTSDQLQIGQTLNPAGDYGGVSSINDEGTLEHIISKVDKSTNFIKTGKADEDLSRYYPNILTITRQQANYQEKHMRAKHIQIKNNLNF